jgi:hypothetical protein
MEAKVRLCDHDRVPGVRYRRTWLMWTWLATVGTFPAATAAIGMVYFSGLIPSWGSWNPAGNWACLLWAALGAVAGIRSVQVCVTALLRLCAVGRGGEHQGPFGVPGTRRPGLHPAGIHASDALQ